MNKSEDEYNTLTLNLSTEIYFKYILLMSKLIFEEMTLMEIVYLKYLSQEPFLTG